MFSYIKGIVADKTREKLAEILPSFQSSDTY